MAPTGVKNKSDLMAVTPRESLTLKRLRNGQLVAQRGQNYQKVQIKPCFPWSCINQYLSLRDRENQEVALIKDIKELDMESRQVVEQELTKTGFVFEIVSVASLETEFEIRNWKVTTRQGSCTFQTELDEWPRLFPGKGLMIKDVAGNLYHIPEPQLLDKKSQKLLWAFID